MTKELFITFSENKQQDTWYPVSISGFESALNISNTYKGYQLKKNIAYELQFIQFLQKQIDELPVSDVLKRMLYKDFIIHAMSVIECVFIDVIQKNGKWRKDKKTSLDADKMTLHDIIVTVRDEKLLPDKNNAVWDELCKYRELRNTVHLFRAKDDQTDYNKFGDIEDQKRIKSILHNLLTSKQICNAGVDKEIIYGFLQDN